MSRTLIYDIEVYRNFFLFGCEDFETGEIKRISLNSADESLPPDKRTWLNKLFHNNTMIGFNSNGYDIIIAWLAISGFTASEIKDWSDYIINQGMMPWEVSDKVGVNRIPNYPNHIDIWPLVKLKPSLKTCAGRLFAPKMQDLPFHPDMILNDDQKREVVIYHRNDLDVTKRLYKRLAVEINLRIEMSREYGVDLRSKSDAQIAEAIIGREMEKVLGHKVFKPKFNPSLTFGYKPPEFINFKNPVLKNILDKVRQHTFRLQVKSAKVELPDFLTDEIVIDGKQYQMGIGGLHSCESQISYIADYNYKLQDADVASYYPASMINSGKWPKPLGPAFLKIYRSFRDRRLEAKHKSSQFFKLGDKLHGSIWKIVAESLKIVLNGTFGKTGSDFSIFYDPEYMIYVTLTGQLSLLMLIERAVEKNIEVVSANTDGVVFYFDRSRQEEVDEIYRQWQIDTGYELEFTEYKSLCLQSVNAYFAVDVEGKVKVKTFYNLDESKIDIEHNPKWAICTKAVSEFLKSGTSIEETVHNCSDIRYFVKVINVKGGGTIRYKSPQKIPDHVSKEALLKRFDCIYNEDSKKYTLYQSNKQMGVIGAYNDLIRKLEGRTEKGSYLGKVVRFYKSTDENVYIGYDKTGNKVPESDGCQPLMEMTGDVPKDLDLQWYIDRSYEILSDIGYPISAIKPKFNFKTQTLEWLK